MNALCFYVCLSWGRLSLSWGIMQIKLWSSPRIHGRNRTSNSVCHNSCYNKLDNRINNFIHYGWNSSLEKAKIQITLTSTQYYIKVHLHESRGKNDFTCLKCVASKLLIHRHMLMQTHTHTHTQTTEAKSSRNSVHSIQELCSPGNSPSLQPYSPCTA